MVLGASFTSFGLSAAGLILFGSTVPPVVTEILALTAVFSAFLSICSAEARFAS